ncbi:type II secretion system F family protein [Moorellaceae bacterium AZ2]
MFEVRMTAFLVFLAAALCILAAGGRIIGEWMENFRQAHLYAPAERGSFWYMLDRLKYPRPRWLIVTILLAVAGFGIGVAINNAAAAVLIAIFVVLYRKEKVEVDFQQYRAALDEQAETALQMIASLYETTGDLIRAIDGAKDCTASPMRDELIRTLAEYRAGASLSEALQSWAERADNRDINIFVRAVTLSEKYGTDTAEVVSEVAQVIRDRILLREELKSEVRGQRLTVNLFLLFLPLVAAALMFFSPEARHVITETIFGKAVMCFVICVEFASWHFTRSAGVVEEL